MPLVKGKSEKSFVKNMKTEMEHGKPKNQSLAIAYAMKRKAQKKKMAQGGEVNEDAPNLPDAQSFQSGMRKATHYASGGQIKDNYQPEHSETDPEYYSPASHEEGEMESGYVNHSGNDVEDNGPAMHEDGKSLNQHMVDMHAETSMAEQDLVDRIMEMRSKTFEDEARYSEGGKIANQEHGEDNNDLAGFSPNEFDDLVLRDDLESSYGEDDNAGDNLGNKQEDEDRADLVDRIMLKNFKQKIPRGYPGR